MSRFEGVRSLSPQPEVVATRLSDASFLVSCLTNVERVIETGPDRAVWTIRTGFSFLSTTLDVSLEVTERSAVRATYQARSKGVGATSLVRAVLWFEPAAEGTQVRYEAEVVERTGLLKVVSPGLIQAAARSVIEETWKGIEAKLREVG